MLLFGYKSMLLFGNRQIFLKFFLIFFLQVMFSLLQYLIILVNVEFFK